MNGAAHEIDERFKSYAREHALIFISAIKETGTQPLSAVCEM